MILTAGLSPAWQQVLVVDGLKPGGLHRASRSYWCGSGKALNAAVAVHHLAGGAAKQSLVLSPLGGPAFEPIDAEFELLGIRRQWIRTKAPTRVCTTIVDAAAETVTEPIENAGELTVAELREFEQAFVAAADQATATLLIGSLPQSVPPDFFRKLLTHARCPAVLDIRGPELLAVLESAPAVVKPNRQEIAQTLGMPTDSDEQLQAAVAELLSRGAQAVVVTADARDVWIATPEATTRVSPPAVATVVNPIGCGDCVAAGIAWGLANKLGLADSVGVGLDAAAQNIQTLLPSDFDGSRERRQRR